MADRFPGYDVLAKRGSQSWNARTRAVVDARLALDERDGLFTAEQLATLRMLERRIVPRPEGRPPVNATAILLDKLADPDAGDGYRHAGLPEARTAWAQALDAIDAEARARFGQPFAALDPASADAIIRGVRDGTARAGIWGAMAPELFWHWRLLPDLVSAYWAHPSAWSAMGFGGPASPRGYVRLARDRRDPWEAVERDGD